MKQDSITLNKLIILYMLKKISFKITKTQLYNFVLDLEYSTYFPIQQVLGELIETKLIVGETLANRTHFNITEEGINTLSFFGNRLDYGIKVDIENFLLENEFQLRNEISILANYYKSSRTSEFEAHLTATEKEITLVDIKISVPTSSMASTICDNWNDKNEIIYKYLIEQLF